MSTPLRRRARGAYSLKRDRPTKRQECYRDHSLTHCRAETAGTSGRLRWKPPGGCLCLPLEQPEELQIGGVFDDHRCGNMRDVLIGSDLVVLHRRSEVIGRCQGAVDRMVGLLVVVQQ